MTLYRNKYQNRRTRHICGSQIVQRPYKDMLYVFETCSAYCALRSDCMLFGHGRCKYSHKGYQYLSRKIFYREKLYIPVLSSHNGSIFISPYHQLHSLSNKVLYEKQIILIMHFDCLNNYINSSGVPVYLARRASQPGTPYPNPHRIYIHPRGTTYHGWFISPLGMKINQQSYLPRPQPMILEQ